MLSLNVRPNWLFTLIPTSFVVLERDSICYPFNALCDVPCNHLLEWQVRQHPQHLVLEPDLRSCSRREALDSLEREFLVHLDISTHGALVAGERCVVITKCDC